MLHVGCGTRDREREIEREREMYGQNLSRLSGTKPSDFVLGN